MYFARFTLAFFGESIATPPYSSVCNCNNKIYRCDEQGKARGRDLFVRLVSQFAHFSSSDTFFSIS